MDKDHMELKIDCIFCKIIRKEIPSLKVFEDENCLCIIPKDMEVYGHILIIPKNHYTNIFDIKSKDLKNLICIAQKLSLHFQKNLGATGINLLHASGKDAGQSVEHFHFHVFPRFKNDNLDTWPKLPSNNFDKKEVLKKLLLMD